MNSPEPVKNRPDLVKDKLELAAKSEAERVKLSKQDPEPSLAVRLGQIGFLGWMIITPCLLALLLGRKLDAIFASGITFSAASLMLGVAMGFWFAWRWMHKQ